MSPRVRSALAGGNHEETGVRKPHSKLVPTLIVALTLALLLPGPSAAQFSGQQTVDHPAQTNSVPAPAALPRSMALEAPPDPDEERARREALLSDHHEAGPLGAPEPGALALPPPPMPLNTSVTSPNIRLLESRALTSAATAGITSTVLEPSVAPRGAEILFTANWFASFSNDGGATFTYVNPSTTFPTIPGQPFCCDQVAIYDAGNDLMIWFLQYVEDGSQNTIRVAVAQGADIAAQQWRFYDFTPLGVGGWNNEWFDFPDLALSDNFLYVTTNTFSTQGTGFTRALILRLPLAQLAAYQGLTYSFFDSTQDFSLRPTQGATDTMYFADHVTTARMRVFAWPEAAAGLTSTDVVVQPWSNAPRAGAGPGGPWLGRSDPRITAAWLEGGTAGFAWSAAQDATFANPHVRVALIDTASGLLTGQPHLWSNDFAYAYPAASPNGDGEIGVAVAFGGGARNPGHAVGTFSMAGGWQLSQTVEGTDSPNDNRWGDYLTVRPDPGDAAAWYATGYSLQGGGGAGNIRPRLVRFDVGVAPPQISVANLDPNRTLNNGDSTTFRATVTQGGTPVANEQVAFSASPGGLVTLSAATATTNASGVAEITAAAVSGANGTATVTSSAAGATDSATVKVPDISLVGLAFLLIALAIVGVAHRRREVAARR